MDDVALNRALAEVTSLKPERDQLRADFGNHVPREEILADAVVELRAERDRLRAVVEAARETVAAWRAWVEKVKVDGNVRSTDDESHRKAASFATLALRVDDLDGSEATSG